MSIFMEINFHFSKMLLRALIPGHHLKLRRLTNPSVQIIKTITTKEGPERDLVNFPRPVRQIEASPLRVGIFPEEWFQFFYKKTGITGPYMFGTGLVNYLISKEFYVLEEEFYSGFSFILLCIVVVKKLGPLVSNYANKKIAEYENSWKEIREQDVTWLKECIKNEKESQWMMDGQFILIEKKRENILLQLEAEYRKRLMTVYNEVKRRLDYQVESEAVRKFFHHKNMVEWVVKEVTNIVQSKEQQEMRWKECIERLKEISKSI